MKKILILGGTNFIGRLLTESLIKTDHDITLFNRGKTNSELFPEIKKVIGDRETNDIEKITNQNWDIVFDLSCYYPNSLEKLLNSLKGKVGKYVFVSTVSVYDTNNQLAINENEKVFSCNESEKTNTLMYTYGNRKAECERILLAHSDLAKVILRPAVVYGKYDYTDRFYYWIYHVVKQNKILFPENGLNSLINFTFVEDLVKTMIYSGFHQMQNEIYNVTTHDQVNISKIINTVSGILNKKVELVNASNQFLNDNQIKVWSDIFYLPYNMFYDNSKILNQINFSFDSFEKSVEKTIDYYKSLNYPKGKFGISLEKENELIAKI